MPDALLRLYFENPVGRLLELPGADYVVLQCHAGRREFAEFKAFLTHAEHLLARCRCDKVLADQRQMSPLTQEESTWLAAGWAGGRERPGKALHGAVLLPEDVFARLAVRRFLHEAPASLVHRFFEEEAAALAWLGQMR